MELVEIRDAILRRIGTREALRIPEDVDDAINRVQALQIQPMSRIQSVYRYTTVSDDEDLDLATHIPDLYNLLRVMDETRGVPGIALDVVDTDTLIARGYQRMANMLIAVGVPEDTELGVFYHLMLPDITESAPTPIIPIPWHHLYVLGGIMELTYSGRVKADAREAFNALLDEFGLAEIYKDLPLGVRVKDIW